MEILFYKNSKDFHFSFGNSKVITIKYEPKLKKIFKRFHKKIENNLRLSKKGYEDSITTKNGAYILSFQDNNVYFHYKENSISLQIYDLKSLYQAMDNYLDKKYSDFLSGISNSQGSFKVPRFYTI